MKHILRSIMISIWFMFLTFPLMVVYINPLNYTVTWRWKNMIMVGIGTFFASFFWRRFQNRTVGNNDKPSLGQKTLNHIYTSPEISRMLLGVLILFTLSFPFIFSTYQTNVFTTALMYVVLGLGLNIVVGLAGLLDLGYVAFYAVGAYSYALLNHHFGVGFWVALPLGALVAAFFGILLGIPVLRLRGDYLAIVTLGFGEIIRLILENWDKVFFGPSGISNISRPAFFGVELVEKSIPHAIKYMYYLVLLLVLFTIFFVNRLKNSRIGRAWIALREDEIACQAMGINKMRTKLTAFALGATWAGMVGVIFAAKTTFINPASFTFMESAIILSIVVLGGMGSIPGVILGAFFLVLLPEYFRTLGDYRMLAFGASMVIMMVFRPQGLISHIRTKYNFNAKEPLA
ncbi:MAG: high-affinity branched-chain amino acid ABC transporter permease LivM [Proteobacteria bacterium]|nr:high-affinity branched-chain amino acid ABC transporter permease LivM [Pseudomonadota bacterium]